MNDRFSEYATSGAFSLTLTRNQVSALAMLDEGSAPDYTANMMAALERKGLVERIPAPADHREDNIEFRGTRAGLLTAALCREAGLTQGARDAVAVELDALRAEAIARRREAAEARLTARSALARLEAAEYEIENLKRAAEDRKLALRIIRRDPLPDVTIEQLRARAEEPSHV
jgi:DNA-binding MarR family transcriptional regulator